MAELERLRVRATRALRRSSPTYLVRDQLVRRVYERFADRLGMLYIGRSSADGEDRPIIRGWTASATHVDDHLVLGSFAGYDLTISSRSDSVKPADGKRIRYNWLVQTIQLQKERDLPRFFVCHQSLASVYATKRVTRKRLNIGHLASYSDDFQISYQVFGKPDRALDIERVFTPDVASKLSGYLANCSFEVSDGVLYIYLDVQHPSEQLLERILSTGVWLAGVLDGSNEANAPD